MIIAIENQSFLDLAVQEEGSVLVAFQLALANGLSITAELAPGQKLITADSEFRNNEVANYFKGKNQMIAAGYAMVNINLPIPPTGIGHMRIGTTFIVG